MALTIRQEDLVQKLGRTNASREIYREAFTRINAAEAREANMFKLQSQRILHSKEREKRLKSLQVPPLLPFEGLNQAKKGFLFHPLLMVKYTFKRVFLQFKEQLIGTQKNGLQR